MNSTELHATQEQQLREMNEALLIASIRQHELAEEAREAEAALRKSLDELRSRNEEMNRFNRVAIGRETRMLELKKEVNQLHEQHGEAATYPLEFEAQSNLAQAVLPVDHSGDGLAPLESVLCTEKLKTRPQRPPDYETESHLLSSLAQALADSPREILQTLTDTILDSFQVGSAGVSLLAEDGRSFYWPAISGAWRAHVGGGTPRDYGPCGDVLDRNTPLLFSHVERRYDYFSPVTPLVEEALLIPFYAAGEAVGTIWVIAHDDRRKFDAEDLRQLVSLGRFASAAYQAVESLGVIGQRRDAALNLMEDAVQARQAMEKLNAELQESHARSHALFEAAPMAVLVCDHDSVILQYNARAVELWGSEPVGGGVLHAGSTNFCLPDGTPLRDSNSPVVEVLRTGLPVQNVELGIERPDGSRLPVLMNCAPLRNARGEITAAIASFIDISERSRLAQQAREQAEAWVDLHRRKDEFLAMLSHELRNPLAPISNAVQLLRLQENETELQQQARSIIERQVTQLTRLVDDLMEVSRITTGRVQLRNDRVVVSGVVERAVEVAQPLIDQRRQELTVLLPPEPILLSADAARLEQVVVNLLTNAAKYTDEGGRIWLTVQLEGDECVLRVRDTGVGIAPNLLPRIFDLFTQAERSLDRSQGGLGIGLALVQRLVELHGGRVEVHSSLGQGSEFVVRLPVMLPTAAPQLIPKEYRESTGPSLRVLVVDDNVDSAKSLAMLLKTKGHQVRVAHDGPAALETALDYRPSVILLDIGLPGLDGYEVAKRLRRQPLFDGATLIALTGYGNAADRELSKEAGFDHHLVKPVNFSDVQKILAMIGTQT